MALIHQLLKEPGSRVQAAVAGWTHPLSREGFLQIDQMDLLAAHWTPKGKTPFRFPRPSEPAQKRLRASRVTDPARLEKFKVKWKSEATDG